MKNIHILPTDKPTGIFQSNSGLQFSIRDKVRVEPLKGFHIYITSDEEIKKEKLRWIIDNRPNMNGFIHQVSVVLDSKICPEIILTTDQDLIKDGVQAIDDDFLEWFVKNPSCKEVDITYEVLKPFEIENKGYIIRFPDNEPLEEPKQETIEEVAENNYPGGDVWTEEQAVIRRLAFKNGAKWQAEQDKKMFSEEEVRRIAKWSFYFHKTNDFSDSELADEWELRLEKMFKNK